MVQISDRMSESLDEFLVQPGWVEESPERISLATTLGDKIRLQYPFITARMQSVVGAEMAVAAGRNGILTMIPRSLRDEDKQAIIDANNKARLRKGDIEFCENPVSVDPETTLEEVLKVVQRVGHSVIPVLDRKSRLYGIYVHNPNNPPIVPPYTPVTEVMCKMNDSSFIVNASDEEIKRVILTEDRRFLPVVDGNKILQKIAFLQKFDTNYVGLAISSRANYKDEVEKWGPQVDTMTIDTSNACFEEALKIVDYAKKRFPDKPFGIGNIVRGKDFLIFAENGADYIIGGMATGSICQTGSERANGRGSFTAAKELAEARDSYAPKRYVPLVFDGGVGKVSAMCVALTLADFVMMGNYFNKFYESPARKFEADKQTPTSEESLMRWVETWGEGHPIAGLVALYGIDFIGKLQEKSSHKVPEVTERYGHLTLAGTTIEGVLKKVQYRGRLKPCVENDANYIRTTMSNAGAVDLKSYREKAVLERASAKTLADMLPHDVV